MWSTVEDVDELGSLCRTSVGIGDGGNECGMGKVLGAVREHIPNGSTIASVVPADALLSAGVSNWGAWGLIAAVEALVRYDAAKFADDGLAGGADPKAALLLLPPGALLPLEGWERSVSAAVLEAGATDGITGASDGSVDGVPLERHLEVLGALRKLLREVFESAPAAAAAVGAASAAGAAASAAAATAAAPASPVVAAEKLSLARR